MSRAGTAARDAGLPEGAHPLLRLLPLAELDLAAWRAQIAWVPQRPHLFAATVAENITLGQPGASQGAIERAAVQAGAAEFIEALPRG